MPYYAWLCLLWHLWAVTVSETPLGVDGSDSFGACSLGVCGMHVNLNVSDVFLMIRKGSRVWGGQITGIRRHSHHVQGAHLTSHWRSPWSPHLSVTLPHWLYFFLFISSPYWILWKEAAVTEWGAVLHLLGDGGRHKLFGIHLRRHLNIPTYSLIKHFIYIAIKSCIFI